MLKRAAYVCLIAALIAGGVLLGDQKGRAAAGAQSESVEQSMAPAVVAADSVPDAVALMQRAAMPACTLDSTAEIALFGVTDVANRHLVIEGSGAVQAADVHDGKFNFNIGYQF